MKTTKTTKATEIKTTEAQARILAHFDGAATLDAASLKGHKLDARAANALVRRGDLTLTNGRYRLAIKKPAKPAATEPANDGAAEAPTEPASAPEATAAPAEAPKAQETATAAKKAAPAPRAAKPAKAPKAPKPAKALNPCTCGCGAQTLARFLPGHDARLHSLVLKISRGQANKALLPAGERTAAYLATAPWATAEILKAIGLPRP